MHCERRMQVRRLVVLCGSLLLVAVLLAGSAGAAVVNVKLRSTTPVSGVLLAEPAGPGVAPVRVEMKAPSEVTIKLPDDAPAWTLSVQSKGGWAASQVISGNRAENVVFDVIPTATFEFRRKVAADNSDRAFRATFQSADRKISGTTECVTRERTVACTVIALPVDVRISAEGLVPHYLWSVAVGAGKTRSEGEIAFVAGASLSGYATSRNKGYSLARTVVELAAERAIGLSGEEQNRAALATQRVQPTKNGFFQFRGLRPGAYVLTAVSGRERSAATKVTIHPNLEAQLKEPLLLQVPFDFHVVVTPPVDPANEPWVLDLKRRNGTPNEAEDFAHHAADAAGAWQVTGLTAGEYLVSVERARGGVWLQKEIQLHDETRIVLPIDVVKVAGKVQIGGTPLAGAVVRFRGANGEIPIRVPKTGAFRAYLPRQPDDLWPEVEVDAEDPIVRATFNDVLVKPVSGGEIAHVLLEVSDRGVQGRVVDNDGNPAREATINLTREDPHRLLQIEADEAGRFSIHGLEEGTFHLRAASRDAESSSVPVKIEAEQKPPVVELRLRPRKRVHGVIRSSSGPVAGARITAMPDDRSTSFSAPRASDAEGRFEAPLNAGSPGVTLSVAAPGYAFRFFRTDVSAEPLLVNVDQIGGRLIVELPTGDSDKWGAVPVFAHGAAYASLLSIPFRAGEGFNSTADVQTVTLPLAEPGEYSVCWKGTDEWRAITRGLAVPTYEPARCTRGYLAPFSELRLRTEPPRQHANR